MPKKEDLEIIVYIIFHIYILVTLKKKKKTSLFPKSFETLKTNSLFFSNNKVKSNKKIIFFNQNPKNNY